MPLPKTGYTKTSTENFIIDAATIFTDFKYEGNEFTGTPLGATSGGVTVTIEQSYRKPEVDGTYIMDVVGLEFMESAKATVTANLKELTAENLRRSLNGVLSKPGAEEAPEGYQVIKTKRYVEEKDYIPTVAVVGIHNGTKKPIIFKLDNGLVTSPLEVGTEDNNEAVVEQTITAHATPDQLLADEFPWAIYYPGEAAPTKPATEPTEEPSGDGTGEGTETGGEA